LMATAALFIGALGFFVLFGNKMILLMGGKGYVSSPVLYFLLGIVSLFYALFICTTVVQYATNKINLILALSVVMCFAGSAVCRWLAARYAMTGLAAGMAGIWVVLFGVLTFQSFAIINKIETK